MEGSKPPVVLRVSQARLAATLLITAFAGLVVLLLSLAMGSWLGAAVGGGILAMGLGWRVYRGRCAVVFEREQVVVITPFSRETVPYQGLNFLLRRSWAVTFHRGLAASGLAGTAIQLRRGKKPVVTISAALWDGKQLRAAIAFLEGLPNPKQYL